VASAAEQTALEGIFDFIGGIFGNVGLFGFPAASFQTPSFRFPSTGAAISVVFDPGGVADEPVVTTPVFERPRGGETPNIPSPPLVPVVSIFSDIVSIITGPRDINATSEGRVLDTVTDIFGEIFRRGTTTAEERVASGDFFEGDIVRAIGNIGGELAGLEGVGDLIGTGLTVFNQQLPPQQGVQQLATQIAPCPVGGGSAGFPAGQCVTIGDWQAMGGPKGFEVAGVSGGGTLILRKKRRRRRRSGLTKGMMTDVDYLARKLGKPAAETYLNRVL